MEEIRFTFHGKKEALEIFNTGGNLVSYLANQNAECPLIGSKIRLVKKLGEGGFGAVFQIEIPGQGKKKYAAKVISKTMRQGSQTSEAISLGKLARKVHAVQLIDIKTFIDINGGDPERVVNPGEKVFIPYYATVCKTEEREVFPRFDGKGETIIPAGSYMCQNPDYSEFIIGILCGALYQNGTSINFIDVFGFSTCVDVRTIDKNVKQYVFMEKITGSLNENILSISIRKIESVNVLLMQTLHAIATYQKVYQLQHNDLHTGNIFFTRVTEDTKFNNQTLYDADWFHYRIDNVDLYFPAIDRIVKIGDFGLSAKYSKPMIGDKETFKGYGGRATGIPWIMNWYAESYDVLFMLFEFFELNQKNEFIRDIFRWSLGIDKTNKDTLDAAKQYYQIPGYRPFPEFVSGIGSRATPYNILTNDSLMKEYMKKPSSGKIVTLGSI